MSTEQSNAEALADRNYWRSLGQPHGWRLFGWTYRDVASFYDETGKQTIEVDVHTRRALERVLALRDALEQCAKFIEAEYSLSTMEAHHDGHPIEKDARPTWDQIWDAIALLNEQEKVDG